MLESRPQEHTTCVTEHDKYAKGATKPGGFAAGGFYGSGKAAAEDGQAAAAGLEFLSSRPPWKCNICNISCTSREDPPGPRHWSQAQAQGEVQAPSCIRSEQRVVWSCTWFGSPAGPRVWELRLCAEQGSGATTLILCKATDAVCDESKVRVCGLNG